MKRHKKRHTLNALLKAAQDVSLFPELPTESYHFLDKQDDLYANMLKRLEQFRESNNNNEFQKIMSPAERRLSSFQRNQRRILNSKGKIFLGFSKVSAALESSYQTLGLNG